MPIETDINRRWEQGIPHHPKSIELMKALEDIDFNLCNDYFCWKTGGDGDNGETLMYEMDIFFERQDARLEAPPRGKFIQQGNDSCCFVYAAANLLLYEDRPLPDLEPIKDVACCRHGATIHHEAVLDALGVSLVRTTDEKRVYANGGILSIMHPIYNLHAVFVAPISDEEVLAVNSWLGPLEARMGRNELDRFLPSPPNNRHWASISRLGGEA